MQVYIRIFLAFIRICKNIYIIPVINQLWSAGSADTRTHDHPARPTAFCWNQNHPRICGEKRIKNRDRGQYRGSPPHMRGKGSPARAVKSRLGITPAYAGKRSWSMKRWPTAPDHPRVCGEKVALLTFAICCKGSPPHMQGKEMPKGLVHRAAGITPAYAGKSPKGGFALT